VKEEDNNSVRIIEVKGMVHMGLVVKEIIMNQLIEECILQAKRDSMHRGKWGTMIRDTSSINQLQLGNKTTDTTLQCNSNSNKCQIPTLRQMQFIRCWHQSLRM